MTHPLEQRIQSVAHRARRLFLWYGVGWFVVCLLGVAFLAGLIDYLLRLQDHGVRIILSLTVLAVAAASFARYLWPALRTRQTSLQVARRIERRFPQLSDRLSSSIEFLRQPSENRMAGSAQLRQTVVAETTALSEGVDFGECLDARVTRRTLAAAAAVGLVVAVVCLWDTSVSALAARRLLTPWAPADWPRRNNLVFVVGPERLARGSDFEVTVKDRNDRLPRSVRLQIRYDDGDEASREEEMRFLDGVMTFRLENVSRRFQYRAVGGDDQSMPWRRLEVVDPPTIEDLDISLHPPDYTGLPVGKSPLQNIRAVTGTRIGLSGRLTAPVRRASVVTRHSDRRHRVALSISTDPPRVTLSPRGDAAWVAQESGDYWIELVDPEGLVSGQQSTWRIQVVADEPPSVSLERPSGSTTHVTADALVELSGSIRDDFGIRSSRLLYRLMEREDDEPVVTSVFEGSEDPPRRDEAGEEKRTVEFDWDLRSVPGLAPGMSIEFRVEATDYNGQTGQGEARRLTIISADELEDRIAARQSDILARLAEVLRVQRDTRSHTESVRIQVVEVGRLLDSDIDHLQGAELSQRQVVKLLVDPGDGVRRLIESLVEDLDRNRVDNPDVRRHMSALDKEIRRLETDHLPIIQREMVASLKLARAGLNSADEAFQPAPEDRRAVDGSLTAATKHQDVVVESLEAMLGELSQWDNYRRFSREVSRVRRDQSELRDETEALRLEMLQAEDDSTAQERAKLKQHSLRQSDLARRFETLQSRMRRMRQELEEDDPLAAATLSDALELAQDLAVGGQMRESARQVEDQRVGQASETQAKVLDGLDRILDALANRREHELERIVDRLRQAEEELTELQRLQKEVRTGLDDSAEQADEGARREELQRLTRRQDSLQERTRRMAQRLERLQAPATGQALRQAGDRQAEAAESGRRGDAQDAADKAKLAEEQLERARQELSRRVAQQEQDLFFEQLARLEQAITGLAARQLSALERTEEMQQLKAAQGGTFGRAQSTTVRDLAAEQRGLAAETGALSDKLAKAEAFALGLRGAMREMTRGSRRLDALDTGLETQDTLRVALDRLNRLIEALKPPEPDDSGDAGGDQGGSGGDQGGSSSPQDEIRALAELKLLKSMQEEVNRRTIQLEQLRRREEGLSDDQQRELVELAEEQGRLADIVFNLIQAASADPVDDPDALPDLPELPDDELDLSEPEPGRPKTNRSDDASESLFPELDLNG